MPTLAGMADDPSLPFILPPGTKVVARVVVRGPDGRQVHPAGAVGVIEASPADHTHSYRVRFMDDSRASLTRDQVVVLRHYQREQGEQPATDASPGAGDNTVIPHPGADLTRFVILRVVVGSRAFGLSTDASDTDYRGVYLPPADLHWSLRGVPEQIEIDATQEVYWELQKFLVLALKANPNVLEVLHSPLVELATPLARELLDMRSAFVSRMVYQTYNGYVVSQFKKLSSDLRNKGHVKWKHVMHLTRLLLAGIAALKTGVVPVRAEDQHRDRLLSIRRGERPWDEVDQWRIQLHDEFDEAFQTTTLPDRPDYERANAFLLRARRAMVGGS